MLRYSGGCGEDLAPPGSGWTGTRGQNSLLGRDLQSVGVKSVGECGVKGPFIRGEILHGGNGVGVFPCKRLLWDIERVPYFPTIQVGDPETKWLTEEDQYLILDQIQDTVYRAFFLFMFKQATRPGEARALRWERVDFKRQEVVIAAAMDQGVYREHTKERDIRVLPLHDEVREALEKLPRDINGFVFTDRGKPLRGFTVLRVWRRACAKVGIDINCYQGTRHSLPSQAINAGVDTKIIQAFLGHKDSRSTARYTHLRTQTLKGMWEVRPQTGPKGLLANDNLLEFKTIKE